MKQILKPLLFSFILLFSSQAYSQETQFQIVYQQLDWTADGSSIIFTAIKVKKDWSDYSPNKWSLFMYDLGADKLEKLDSGSLYFSISGEGILAYDKTFDGNRDIYFLNLHTRKPGLLVQSSAKDGGPSWSRDGKSLVYYSNREGSEELFVSNLTDGSTRRITTSDGHKCYNPVWSPKTDHIVYYFEKGDNKDQIYLTDSKGSFHTNLTNDDHHNIFPSWTPDGRIVYIRDQGEVMIMNSDGLGKKQLLESSGGQVRMDPSGKYLLTISDTKDLVKVNLKNGEITTLLKAAQVYP